jgi:hypothetical protein
MELRGKNETVRMCRGRESASDSRKWRYDVCHVRGGAHKFIHTHVRGRSAPGRGGWDLGSLAARQKASRPQRSDGGLGDGWMRHAGEAIMR